MENVFDVLKDNCIKEQLLNVKKFIDESLGNAGGAKLIIDYIKKKPSN